MKTIYVDRNVAFIDGFNKVLDEINLHQGNTLLVNSTFSGLYIEPKFNETIQKNKKHYEILLTDKPNKKVLCDIYLSDNIERLKGKPNLKILYTKTVNLSKVPLDDNIYIINSWEELDTILNFYRYYDLDSLEKKE